MRCQERGLIHIYCGNGKGKTTAALGLAVRAAGRGRRVCIARFLKTEDSGEVPVLRQIPQIHVLPCEKSFGFTFRMTEGERREAALYYGGLFAEATARAKQDVDLLILDEIIGACNAGLVEKEALERSLKEKPPALEVILTGRGPWEEILKMADYVTEMEMRRHPYEKGIGAREGIEY
ncbi:MAG: cob(I)yrinic acid a,c-diamide adenosyltransferase [Lachnospiraceae bacterium]|nr:cob(I)yrinic acid a,c-diamide adenosyltransferase [Lachnospiraceae bacterium]